MKIARYAAASALLFATTSAGDSIRTVSAETACPAVGSAAFYYPADTFPEGYKGEDQFDRAWFTKHLAAMKEPSLSCAQLGGSEAYRFLFLPTWRHPQAVRISNSGNGAELDAIELSGAGGYKPGTPLKHDHIRLSAQGWNELKSAIDTASFWSARDDDELVGDDGDQWIIEGVRDGKYRAITRWMPSATPFAELGRTFFKLAGLKPTDE